MNVKVCANRATCWPIFRPTSDQHVGLICFEHEKMKEKCWPTFLKKLKNVDQQICKNGLKWRVGAVCGASQHGIWIRMFFYDTNVEIAEFRQANAKNTTSRWMDMNEWKKVVKANRTNMLVWFVGQHVVRLTPALRQHREKFKNSVRCERSLIHALHNLAFS